MVDYIFEQGERVATGSHGQTDYVFASGTPVPNTGVSDLVFESGVGLGGELSYEVNGGGLNALEAIGTAETHDTFYDYDTSGNAGANHNYDEYQVVTLFVHEDTNNDTYGLVCTAGNQGDSEPGTSVRVDYSTAIDSSSDYLVVDGESSDAFTDTYAGLGWNGPSTDGFVIDGSAVSDITFTLDNSYSHYMFATTSGPDEFRIITKDGSTPDGGEVVYAGMSGSIRIVIP